MNTEYIEEGFIGLVFRTEEDYFVIFYLVSFKCLETDSEIHAYYVNELEMFRLNVRSSRSDRKVFIKFRQVPVGCTNLFSKLNQREFNGTKISAA